MVQPDERRDFHKKERKRIDIDEDRVSLLKIASAIDGRDPVIADRMERIAALTTNLFHGAPPEPSESILETGVITPRRRNDRPNHPRMPSQTGQLYMSKFPGTSGYLAMPPSKNIGSHPDGSAGYIGFNSGGHIFQIDPETVREEFLSPDEDFVAFGITDTFLEANPEFADSIVRIIEDVVIMTNDLVNKELSFVGEDSRARLYSEEMVHSMTRSLETLSLLLEEGPSGSDFYGNTWISQTIESIANTWAIAVALRERRLGLLERWNNRGIEDRIDALSVQIHKIIAKRISSFWNLSLDQFGSIRSSHPVGVERAIRFSPSTLKGVYESLRTPPQFDPFSLEDMIETEEWEEVPVKRNRSH